MSKQTKNKLNWNELNWSAQKFIYTDTRANSGSTNSFYCRIWNQYIYALWKHLEITRRTDSTLARHRDEHAPSICARIELNKYVKPTSPLKPLPYVAINANEIHARLSNICIVFFRNEKIVEFFIFSSWYFERATKSAMHRERERRRTKQQPNVPACILIWWRSMAQYCNRMNRKI